MNAVNKYISTFEKCQPHRSIVNCCIISSIEGNFGDYHHPFLSDRCRFGVFKIDESTSTYYIFNFDKVINNILYIDKLNECKTWYEVDTCIDEFNKIHNKHWKSFKI